MIDSNTLSNKEFYALNGFLTSDRTEKLIESEEKFAHCNIEDCIDSALGCLADNTNDDTLSKHVNSIDKIIHSIVANRLRGKNNIVESLIELRDALDSDVKADKEWKNDADAFLNQALSMIPGSVHEDTTKK